MFKWFWIIFSLAMGAPDKTCWYNLQMILD